MYEVQWFWRNKSFEDLMNAVNEWLAEQDDSIEVINTNLAVDGNPDFDRSDTFYFTITFRRI